MSRDILLTLIDPDPEQPRQHFDKVKINELAESMKQIGLAVPILLRPAGERYIIVHGERRWRAAKQLGWKTILADVREVSPDESRWLALIENVQRADLSPIEEAQAYQARIADGITQAALAKRIGKTQSYIAQKLRLLKLPEPIRFYLDRGAITEGHARQLLRLHNVYTPELMRDCGYREDANWHVTLPKIEHWRLLGTALLDDLRPFAWPPIWFSWLRGAKTEVDDLLGFPTMNDAQHGKSLSDDDTDRILAHGDTIVSVCRQLWSHLYDNKGQIPQWQASAFWWASFAIIADLSVADLSEWIDDYISMFRAGVYLADLYKVERSLRQHGVIQGNSRIVHYGADLEQCQAVPLLENEAFVKAAIKELGGAEALVPDASYYIWGPGLRERID